MAGVARHPNLVVMLLILSSRPKQILDCHSLSGYKLVAGAEAGLVSFSISPSYKTEFTRVR